MATYLIGFVISDFVTATNELSKEPEGTLHRLSVWILNFFNNLEIIFSFQDKAQCE